MGLVEGGEDGVGGGGSGRFSEECGGRGRG